MSQSLPVAKYTGQEFVWNNGGGGSAPVIYVCETLNPIHWRVFNLACSDEAREYEEFKEECASLCL